MHYRWSPPAPDELYAGAADVIEDGQVLDHASAALARLVPLVRGGKLRYRARYLVSRDTEVWP